MSKDIAAWLWIVGYILAAVGLVWLLGGERWTIVLAVLIGVFFVGIIGLAYSLPSDYMR